MILPKHSLELADSIYMSDGCICSGALHHVVRISTKCKCDISDLCKSTRQQSQYH